MTDKKCDCFNYYKEEGYHRVLCFNQPKKTLQENLERLQREINFESKKLDEKKNIVKELEKMINPSVEINKKNCPLCNKNTQ